MAGRADAKEMDVDGEDPASRPTGLAGGRLRVDHGLTISYSGPEVPFEAVDPRSDVF
jgi:hypothetical protein